MQKQAMDRRDLCITCHTVMKLLAIVLPFIRYVLVSAGFFFYFSVIVYVLPDKSFISVLTKGHLNTPSEWNAKAKRDIDMRIVDLAPSSPTSTFGNSGAISRPFCMCSSSRYGRRVGQRGKKWDLPAMSQGMHKFY